MGVEPNLPPSDKCSHRENSQPLNLKCTYSFLPLPAFQACSKRSAELGNSTSKSEVSFHEYVLLTEKLSNKEQSLVQFYIKMT